MKHTLAAAALALWEDEVRRFAPDEHLRWQRLLQILPDALTPDQLRDALAPIAAKNDKEQALFADIFERAAAQTAALHADGPVPPPPPPPPPFWKKHAPLLLAAAAAATMALLAWWLFFQKKTPAPELLPDQIRLYRMVEAGGQATLCPDSALLASLGGVQSATFGDPATTWGRTGYTRTLRLGTATLDSAGCLRYAALPDTAGRDTVRYRLTLADGRSLGVEAEIEVARPVATGPTKKEIQYLFVPQPPPFDHDPLLRAMQFEEADPLARTLARWAWLIRLLVLAAAAAALWAWALARARKRQKLVARRDKDARPPYVWPIRIPGLAPPEPGEAFGPALNALRRRADDEHLLLDLPATVRATIRRGGMTRFMFRRQTRPPEYLLLVDRADPRDHRARFYDELYRLLLLNEVLVVRFFFDGDARLCHNDEHPEGLSLDDLLFRHPHHRLLVIGDGRRWFSAATGRLAPWTDLLARWKDRALLSTLPAADWGRRERSLGARFRFAPATVAGLRAVVELFESDDAEGRLPDPARMAPLAMPAPVALGEEGDLLHALETQLPDEDTRTWLAACALWPELHYDLTCWLGAWLAQETGRPLLSFARLADLLRLPWFATGEMPDPARAALLDWLRQTRPGLENRLREALHALLEQHGPPTDSAAWDDYGLHLAFNQWLTTTDPNTKKALEAQIARWMDEHGAPDFITVRELRGRPGPLDQLLPDAWKKRLFKGHLPALGLRDTWKDGLRATVALAALALGLYLGWQPLAPECAGEKAEVRLADTTGETLRVCADTDAERALLLEYLLRQAAAERDITRFDSLLNQLLAPNITLDTASRYNVSNSAYNAALPDYRQADGPTPGPSPQGRGDGPTPPLPLGEGDAAEYRRRACAWFSRAAATAPLPGGEGSGVGPPWITRAAAWCAAPDEQVRIDIRPAITGRVLDSATGAPLPGVRVQGPGADLRTTADGRYTLRLPTDYPSPQVSLRFSAAGYETLTRTFIVEGADSLPALPLVKIPPPTTTEPARDPAATEPGNAPPPVATTPDPGPQQPGKDQPTTGQTEPGPARPGEQTALPLPDLPLPDMVEIKAGAYTRGCTDEQGSDCWDDEKPPHRVTLTKDFYLARTEVTNAQYAAFLNEKGNQEEGGAAWLDLQGRYSDAVKCRIRRDKDGRFTVEKGYEEHPVIYVSWYGARAYCDWLSARTGKRFRLPTEAEWEYAARGGHRAPAKQTKYAGSDNADEVAWYSGNSKSQPQAVGQKKPNALGLYDMSGNVYEWCSDGTATYTNAAQTDPVGPSGGSRVVRGGAWGYSTSDVRVSSRLIFNPDFRYDYVGFRAAQDK